MAAGHAWRALATKTWSRGEARLSCPIGKGKAVLPRHPALSAHPGATPLPQVLWAGLFCARAGCVRGRMILLPRPVSQSLVQKGVFQQES